MNYLFGTWNTQLINRMNKESGIATGENGILEKIKLFCPCRSYQIEQLCALFGEKDELSCPCVFVYGHTGTGKNHVLKTIMNLVKIKHIVINCIECHSAKLIFETVLESVEKGLDGELDVQNSRKCDNFNDFIRYLKVLLIELNVINETFCLIFKRAERLRYMDSNLLPGFMRLAELTKMNICVIFVTELTTERFLSGTSCVIRNFIHFSEYNQTELVKILSLDCPTSVDKTVYSTYCQLLVSVFYLACRDLNELRHLAIGNFNSYYEPLKENKKIDVRRLWRNIEPKLKKCLSNVYLREVATTKGDSAQDQSVSKPGKMRVALELPFLSKYLLIAAFLASNNPARTDRRYFCKATHGKMSKRAKSSIKSYTPHGKLTGPKAFPLDRLLAIFFSIVEEEVDANANLLTEISSLVNLNLLAKISADDQIDMAKYRCLANLDFISSLAENVDFQLGHYLFEV